jgi:hypothetical protein
MKRAKRKVGLAGLPGMKDIVASGAIMRPAVIS